MRTSVMVWSLPCGAVNVMAVHEIRNVFRFSMLVRYSDELPKRICKS